MIASSPSDVLRWAEVNTAALRENAAAIKTLLRPETALMVMVKSNGYGHDAVTAARAGLAGGATWLGVYTPDEALELRRSGIDAPILVAGWSPPSIHAELVRDHLDVAVFDIATLRSLARCAAALGRRARAHIKVDTGLKRLGVGTAGLREFADAVAEVSGSVEVVGILTHFADAENDIDFTRQQHAAFLDAVEVLRPVAPAAMLHTAGSAAILSFPETHHDLVRLGIAFYGYSPPSADAPPKLRVGMSVFARVVQVKEVAAGDSVGYGRTWRARDVRRIATIAIGYGQGLPRALSNRGSVVLHGQRCRIAGIVNMDQITVDTGDVDNVRVGDAAMVFGERDGIRLGADEVAQLVGTIPHELLCGVSTSVPRVPVSAADRANDGRPTAVP